MSDVEKLKELAEKATKGPWRVVNNSNGTINIVSAPDDEGWSSKVALVNNGNAANAQLIAAANSAATLELLAELASLRAQNERMREALRPFADEFAGRETHYPEYPIGGSKLQNKHLRAARAALSET